MSDDFIGIDITGEDEIARKLKGLPPAAQDAAVDEMSKYLLNVLRLYPPQKYVSRKDAYGVSFFSDKQRRWFFAALKSGELSIPYKRSYNLRDNWKQLGRGASSIIVNETSYAKYVMGDKEQSRHEQKVGWKKLGDIVKERMGRVLEKADAGIKRAIKKSGL